MYENVDKSKVIVSELWDQRIIENVEVGTFNGLQAIHKYIYQDVFPFAEELREVNISKGNFRFASIIFLKSNLEIIDEMKHNSFDEIIEKYFEMNIAHPFREGNGRATRIWLDQMLKQNLKQAVDWSVISKDDYLSAMERSPVNSLEIKVSWKQH